MVLKVYDYHLFDFLSDCHNATILGGKQSRSGKIDDGQLFRELKLEFLVPGS